MFLFFRRFLLAAGVFVILSGGPAWAGMPSKGLKTDPLLKQAIIDSAIPDAVPEKDVDEIPAEPPILETKGDIAEAEPPAGLFDFLPTMPVYIEEREDSRPLFKWPEEPGLVYNSILFLPSLFVKQGWNSNLFAIDNGGDGDLVTQLKPRLRIELPESRHEFVAEGSWEYIKHFEHEKEDQHNTEARMEGALLARYGISVPFGVWWERTHENREDDLTRQNPLNPLDVKTLKMESGVSFKPRSFGIALLGRYQTERFGDDRQRGTLAPIIRHDADRDTVEMEFNTSFDLDPHNTLMLWGRYGKRDYEHRNFENGGFTGPRRDSDKFTGMMSWLFEYAGITGHMSLGVDDWNYDNPQIQDVREIVGDLEITHQIRPLTTVNLQLERAVFEDAEVVDPLIRSRFGFYVDHQPWDDVLVATGADYNFLEFNNSGRDDESWDFRVIADYFFNEFLAFGGEYAYTIRDSEAAGLDFNRNVFLLRARGRL